MITENNAFKTITSGSNKYIKYIRELYNKKYRKKYNQYIIEGKKTVEEALVSKASVELVVFSQSALEKFLSLKNQVLDQKVKSFVVSDILFDQISDTKTPEGVMAVVNIESFDINSVLSKPSCFLIVLDGVKDPGNLGTVIRTCDAAGGNGVVLINDCVDPYNPKVVRSTMGSILRMPIFSVDRDDTERLINSLTETGFQIIVSHLEGENLFNWDFNGERIALVIGSESHGADDKIVSLADSLIKIPMPGGAESLNASVAAGILIYDIVRRSINR